VCTFVASNAKRKEKKEVLVTSNNESKLFKGKFYFLYEHLKTHPQLHIYIYIRMSSVTFDKLLVLLGPILTFHDTRMRKSVPPEERLAVTLR
jgi:hypothetical protein